MVPHPVSRFLSVITLLGVSSLLASCAALEFDRMTGTAFPTQQMINGQAVSLASIYDDAGINVDVQEDETGIQPLNIPRTTASATLNSPHWRTAIVTSRSFQALCARFSSAIPIISMAWWWTITANSSTPAFPVSSWARCGRAIPARPL